MESPEQAEQRNSGKGRKGKVQDRQTRKVREK
jgi:hypothetical protein